MGPIPVLWLCGPSGVGKSTVAFGVFEQLARAGTPVGYVDLDQLGLSHPVPADDPANHRVKARNLGEVWAAFRAAGARCLVISGLVDDAGEVRRHADRMPGAALTVCRLRVDVDEHRRRFSRRGSLLHLAEESVRNGEALDRSGFADLVIDTSGITPAEVVARVRASGWPPPDAPSTVDGRPPPTAVSTVDAQAPPSVVSTVDGDAPVTLVCGPRAVGKSTVGFEIFQQLIRAGRPAAYVDLAQISFCRPAPDDDPGHHRLATRLLARLRDTYRAAGIRHLVVSGNVPDEATIDRYRAAIPDAAWSVVNLRAKPGTLLERFLLRGRGGGPAIMGDDLRGLPEPELHRRAAAAARPPAPSAAADPSAGPSARCHLIDTDARSVAEIAGIALGQLAEYGLPGQ